MMLMLCLSAEQMNKYLFCVVKFETQTLNWLKFDSSTSTIFVFCLFFFFSFSIVFLCDNKSLLLTVIIMR